MTTRPRHRPRHQQRPIFTPSIRTFSKSRAANLLAKVSVDKTVRFLNYILRAARASLRRTPSSRRLPFSNVAVPSPLRNSKSVLAVPAAPRHCTEDPVQSMALFEVVVALAVICVTLLWLKRRTIRTIIKILLDGSDGVYGSEPYWSHRYVEEPAVSAVCLIVRHGDRDPFRGRIVAPPSPPPFPFQATDTNQSCAGAVVLEARRTWTVGCCERAGFANDFQASKR